MFLSSGVASNDPSLGQSYLCSRHSWTGFQPWDCLWRVFRSFSWFKKHWARLSFGRGHRDVTMPISHQLLWLPSCFQDQFKSRCRFRPIKPYMEKGLAIWSNAYFNTYLLGQRLFSWTAHQVGIPGEANPEDGPTTGLAPQWKMFCLQRLYLPPWFSLSYSTFNLTHWIPLY